MIYLTSPGTSYQAWSATEKCQKCYKTPLPLKDTAPSSATTVCPLHWFPLYYQVMKLILIARKVDVKGKQICVSASYLHNPNILLGKRQSKMRQKGKSSRAVSLWNCTHRFRSSCIQLPCTFPDVTVFSNNQHHHICAYIHSLFLPQQLILPSSTLAGVWLCFGGWSSSTPKLWSLISYASLQCP